MSHLSATELSRLHRQRRLESTTRGATLLNLKARRRRSINTFGGSSSERDVNKGLSNGDATHSVDAQSTAADSSMTDRAKNISIISSEVKNNAAIVHTRSSSFSSFSDLSSTAMRCISSPQGLTRDALAVIVSPPESPKREIIIKDHRSPARGRPRSPTTSVGPIFEGSTLRFNPNSPHRPSLGRTNSTRSLPQRIHSSPVLMADNSDMPLDEPSTHSHRTRSPLPPPCYPLQSLETSIVPVSSSIPVIAHPHHKESPLIRMAHAIQQRESPPASMNADERHLWDVIQSYAVNAKSTGVYWERKYELRETEWAAQQKDHDRALLAMQRVLADVTTERELAITRLKEELERSQEQCDGTILKLTQKLRDMQKDMKARKEANEDIAENSNNAGRFIQELKHQVEYMQSRIDAADLARVTNGRQMVEIDTLPGGDSNFERPDNAMNDGIKSNANQIEKLEQLESIRFQQTTTTTIDEGISRGENGHHNHLIEMRDLLENVKKTIGCLETANGTLVRELRAKLNEKEETLAKLIRTSADREHTVDHLSVELQGLKRAQQNPRLTRNLLENQRELCQLLEVKVNSLRQAAVRFDGRNDQPSVDNIAQIVSETFTSLKQNLESWNTYLTNADAEETDEETTAANTSHEENLERALAKKDDETKKLRKEIERIRAEHIQESGKMHQEINSLKDRLANNMEILAKKGLELSVLRESLNVEDGSVGYISDDGTDGYETETEQTQPTLLHGHSGPETIERLISDEVGGEAAAEIQYLKNEIIKHQKERDVKAVELRAEKESLANAKMIISSLEKANKSMLEDLRSRLQDSNTAIASLLDKSMEHERTISMLHQELKTEKREKEKVEQKLKSQVAKLRDENLVFSVRLAAKEREIEELQLQIEGQEVPISVSRLSSVEEKKDDPVSEEET